MTMMEQRIFARHSVRIAGKLVATHAPITVDCVIANLSEDGALITGRLSEPLPKRLYLWQAETGTLFRCEVRWQKGNQAGLRFVDAASRPWRVQLIEKCCAQQMRSYARSQRRAA
jgi:hypothetical protein